MQNCYNNFAFSQRHFTDWLYKTLYIYIYISLWYRALKDWHRMHSLVKGVFPMSQKEESYKEMG